PTRLYPLGEAPQSLAPPYALWQTEAGAPENYLGQRPDIDSFTLQLDVYADTANAARNAAKALRDAVEPHAHITRWGGESKDPDTNRYRVSFDVDWWTPR
ncbi:MAG: tail completion protein gp17, partial [Solimonas sp.]